MVVWEGEGHWKGQERVDEIQSDKEGSEGEERREVMGRLNGQKQEGEVENNTEGLRLERGGSYCGRRGGGGRC